VNSPGTDSTNVSSVSAAPRYVIAVGVTLSKVVHS
jgi:hypothetical protein